MQKYSFFLCGLMGWCLEIFWTGLGSLRRRQPKLIGHSSFWMFPIYGLASLFGPLSRILKNVNIWIRGSLYALCIFLVEFISGSLLKKYNLCPWDYSKARLNYKGVIRLDFFPLWFLTGLMYEQILKRPAAKSNGRP